MKSRKQRITKAGHSKRKVPSDVSPSTGLPPLVEGQLRCFLRVTISRLLWTVHKPPSATFVRLRWWGESSNGTQFFPRDGSQASQKTVKTTARFPIRCGPKQFTSYLTDMGSLVLEVLTKMDHLPIARAQVAGIPRLSLSNPISGFYTLVSPTSDKMGELQVSLCLEPLTEAYDSSSSGPATDISIEKAPQDLVSSELLQSKEVSTGSGKESAGSSGGKTPRGKDHLYFPINHQDKEGLQENEKLPSSQTSQAVVQHSSQKPGTCPTSDIISVILDRGNKLRNAMVVSAVKSDPTLKDIPLPLPKDNILLNTKPLPPSGTLLQNILCADASLKHHGDAAGVSDYGLDSSVDIDNKAVDLLLGSTSPLPHWDGQDLSTVSLSSHSSLCMDSELNDPQYDQSLLENLFYKTPMVDSTADHTELDVQAKQPKHNTSGAAEKSLTQSKVTNNEDSKGIPHSLTADQLTLLSMVQLLRVSIDSLAIPSGITTTSPNNAVSKGRPPRPLSTKKCTYFVEYVLPRSSIAHHLKTAEEVTRAVSSKITGGAVKFNQRSVFPIHLSTTAVKQWWETDIVFSIYSRKSDQKKPVFIGRAVHPLRCLLQSKQLCQTLLLPVSVERSSETKDIGPLKVSLELVTGKKDSKISHKTLKPSDTTPWDTAPMKATALHEHVAGEDLSVGSRLQSLRPQRVAGETLCQSSFHTSHHKPCQEGEKEVLLHTLLMVPDGKSFQCAPLQAPNVYLNCKLFWCNETVRSPVAWGQANPTFNFVQVTPVALTTKLLERMRNNVMVIEVWQKIRSSTEDHLLGLVKLPLHQFYMSFRDMKIASLLLQAQYPVLGVDCYMPVIDVFSGSCKGNLRVILAMGQSEQIAALQSARDEKYESPAHLVRPVHLLDHQPHSKQTMVTTSLKEIMREHVFVIKVEKVSGLTPLQSTVWGEADCYIQYSFPCQKGDLAVKIDLIDSNINLEPFRTTTTLCVPDPVFGHTERHVLLAPEGVPIQKLLLSSLSFKGLSSGGGVQFEVWCRYYYPNVRDQLVAKGILPLSKLCAMVTMQRLHNEAQMFSLPLVPWTDSPTGHQSQPSGLLDVSVQYKHRPVRPEGQMGRGAASRLVTLVIQIHRASGLKAAARVVSEKNERFSYYTSVGVNSYITAQLSFLPERETRCTRIVARTFSPEFDHYMEMSCDLLLQRSTGETCSLAEQLEQASAIFTVWNRESREAVEGFLPKDVKLGTVKVPLSELIHKRTGISGWFGVHASKQTCSSEEQQVLVGGIEITVNFAHHSDRERVIKAAQGLGWEMALKICESEEHEESWEESMSKISLTFSVPRAWIPVHCLLLPGLREFQRSTYCYFRYKFYDQEAFCSHMKHPAVEDGQEEGLATVSFEGSRTVELKGTQPLIWYLREEKLEIQLWVAFTKARTERPSDSDRLVGSAFLDMSALAKMFKQKLTLSGVYPLFRRAAADLEGAALRVHITLILGPAPKMTPLHTDIDSQEELSSEEVEVRAPSPTALKSSSVPQRSHQKRASENTDLTSAQHMELNCNESFPVTIVVDRAMHLNLKGCPLAERKEGEPCCCVSYVTADSAEPVSTAVVSNSDSPVWDHQHECRLSNELLVDPQQSLVFKVWHKGEIERVIGFASVDLSPLLCGFQSVCGWYNITDFSGQCHGQLKVSITPLKGIQDLRRQRKTVCEESAKKSPGLFQALPVSYHTTGTYSSFPSHISRYPEQKISSPDHTDMLFSERSSESDRHFEHMDKVRLHHQSLQEQTAAHSVSSAGDPSSSVLFSLRKKIGELDNIHRYFSRKLSTPTFPLMNDQDFNNKQEEQRTSETDTHQLLLRSNLLVGQVNNIISGLQGQHLKTIPSITQSILNSPVDDCTLQTVPERSSTPHRTSESSREHKVSPMASPPPMTSEEHVNSEEEPDVQNYITTLSEEEGEQETEDEEQQMGQNRNEAAEDDDEAEAEEEEDDDEYEVTVVKPRHLNELTSLTDKTSPWTSILSDPDTEDPEISLGEKGEQQTTDVHIQGSSDNPSSDCEEDHKCQKSEHTSESSESDTDGESPRTRENLQKREDQKAEPGTKPEDKPKAVISPESQDPSCTVHSEDRQLQPSVLMELPNFFLPSHQLEATMKAIRLAPSFSHLSTDQVQSAPDLSDPPAKGPRQRPNMSPTSVKKETERIARIFAAHFDEDQKH